MVIVPDHFMREITPIDSGNRRPFIGLPILCQRVPFGLGAFAIEYASWVTPRMALAHDKPLASRIGTELWFLNCTWRTAACNNSLTHTRRLRF